MNKYIVGIASLVLSASSMAASFSLKSDDVQANKPIPLKFAFNSFGCVGENVSPSLSWSGAPEGTKSFAITVHDPDAVTGGAGFWHWVVVDIPANANSLTRGAGTLDGKGLPVGSKQIATDFGSTGWGGPCPPVGDTAHKYNFTIYALKTEKLSIPENPTASLTGFMINQNVLGVATFTSTFGR